MLDLYLDLMTHLEEWVSFTTLASLIELVPSLLFTVERSLALLLQLFLDPDTVSSCPLTTSKKLQAVVKRKDRKELCHCYKQNVIELLKSMSYIYTKSES